MTSTSRSRYHHGDLRSALLAAGEQVLAERGAPGLTLRECARRAGVSHAAPKHHFGDMTGFLTELAARGYHALVGRIRMRRAAVPDDDLDAQMYATSMAYIGFARECPEMFRLMFRCDLLDIEAPVLLTGSQETFAELTSVILQQRGAPPIRAEDLRDALAFDQIVEDILIGWCHIHGMAHLLIEGQLTPMLDDDPAAFLERVMHFNAPRLSSLVRVS